MRIKDKKFCKLWGFTEKSDFGHWFIKKTINRGDFLKKGELRQLADLRGDLVKKGWCF